MHLALFAAIVTVVVASSDHQSIQNQGAAAQRRGGDAQAWVKDFTKTNGCTLFSMKGCGACKDAKALFKKKGAKFAERDILNQSSKPSGNEIAAALETLTGDNGYPSIWIGGKFLDQDLDTYDADGKLDGMLKDAGCTGASPTSHPTKTPSPTSHPSTSPTPTEAPVPSPTQDPAEVDAWLDNYIKSNPCIVVGWEGCSYCHDAEELFKSKHANYGHIDCAVNTSVPTGNDTYTALIKLTKQDTLPYVFIGTKFIGGLDSLKALNTKGDLDSMVKTAGCTGAGPTQSPTGDPTTDPTDDPTTDPTESPTADPTATPTDGPTEAPSSSGWLYLDIEGIKGWFRASKET